VAAVLALPIGLGLAGCQEGQPVDATPLVLRRSGRLGGLRDLVLIDRLVDGRQLQLFVDRFEATRGDWAEFAASPAGRAVAATAPTGDPVLPMGNVDLTQARAFAAWRYGRLPRAHEWSIAALGDGRTRYPWGNKDDPTRANTLELGLGEPTPVGAFESGRRPEGGQPYDWIGNVSEWTETVPLSWCLRERTYDPLGAVLDPPGAYTSNAARARALPALAVWTGPGGLVSPAWAAMLGGRFVPREVWGADFQAPMSQLVELVPAGDRRARTGVRICMTPRELLTDLAASPQEPTAADREQLRRFVARAGHRAVLQAIWPQIAGRSGTLARWLDQELGGGG
jgi:hypothetical protein